MAIWAPIMTSLRDHRKAAEAGDRAMWLYVCMHLFCHERDTNGRVSVHELTTLSAQRGKLALTKRLVSVGLLTELEDGWEIVKYDEKGPKAAARAGKRDKWRDDKRRQRDENVHQIEVDTKTAMSTPRAEQSKAEHLNSLSLVARVGDSREREIQKIEEVW